MKKLFIILAMALSLTLISGTASACFLGIGCDDEETNTEITNNNTNVNKPTFKTNITNWNHNFNKNENENNNLNLNINKNDVNVKNKVKVDVDTTDVNINKNYNQDTNINFVKPEQDQHQGQIQGQGQKQGQDQNQDQNQGQDQSQSMGQEQAQDNDQNMELTIVHPENKREHIQAPALPNQENLYSKGFPGRAKVQYKVLDRMPFFKDEHAAKLSKGCSDYELKEDLVFDVEAGDGINNLNYGDREPTGVYMGALILTSDGDDVTADGCVGRVLERAMDRGATEIKFTLLGQVEAAESDSKSLGFTSSASVAGTRDQYMVAPGGGTGTAWADAWNEMRPEMVAEIYYNSAHSN